MRIFNSAVEAVKEVERDLWEMGHTVKTKTYQDKSIEGNEDYETKEIVGYSFTLLSGRDWIDCFTALGMKDAPECAAYCRVEAQERLDPEDRLNPGPSYHHRLKVWEPFLQYDVNDKDLVAPYFDYTYPERLHGPDRLQLEGVILLHRHDSQSRQLVMPIYDVKKDNHKRGGLGRVPCTMHYQLLHRGDTLYLISNMRSCDLYTHFPVDMSIAWLMVEEIAKQWTIKNPAVIFQIASLHAFKKDMVPRGIF